MNDERNTILQQLKEASLPLAILDPSATSNLDAFSRVVGEASIVGLGEASHGAHEYFVAKYQLIRYLVENHQFSMVAIEMGWMGAKRLNEYIQTGEGDPRTLLAGNGFRIWQTEEFLALIIWLRKYNSDPVHENKVQFVGFDAVALDGLYLDQIIEYFRSVDRGIADEVTELYQNLPRSAAHSPLPEEVRQKNYQAASKVRMLLEEKQQAYTQLTSADQFAEILQDSRIVEYYTYRKSLPSPHPSKAAHMNVINARDRFMAENIRWLHEHRSAGSKMILWAHNYHVGTWGRFFGDPFGENESCQWMGSHLRQWYQEKYVNLGFCSAQGSINAYLYDEMGRGVSGSWIPRAVQQVLPDSYEATFDQVGEQFILDMRTLPEKARKWMLEPRLFRQFDTDYCEQEGRFYQVLSLPKYQDVIFYIREISASHMLPDVNLHS